MKKYRVISGDYEGRVGSVKGDPRHDELIMFYPEEGIHPYRVCLRSEQVEVYKEDNNAFMESATNS